MKKMLRSKITQLEWSKKKKKMCFGHDSMEILTILFLEPSVNILNGNVNCHGYFKIEIIKYTEYIFST